jgi:hypothetical protein
MARLICTLCFCLVSALVPRAHAQSIVGTWFDAAANEVTSFQANGRWQTLGTAVCDNGSYTASGGSMSITAEFISADCLHPLSTPVPKFIGSGSYSVTVNSLVGRLTGGVDGPLDLNMAAITTVPPSTLLPPPPPTQASYTISTGQLPAAAVQVSATGTFGSATIKVTLDIVQALPASGFAASTYNVYVVAQVPGALLGSASPVIFVKAKAPGGWGPLQFPIAAYLEDVVQIAISNQVVIDIVTNTNISSLVGTEIYVGFGTSSEEMLAARRYRGVYKVL